MAEIIRVTIEWIDQNGTAYDAITRSNHNEELTDVARIVQCLHDVAGFSPAIEKLRDRIKTHFHVPPDWPPERWPPVRLISIMEREGICCVEDAIEFGERILSKAEGVGKTLMEQFIQWRTKVVAEAKKELGIENTESSD